MKKLTFSFILVIGFCFSFSELSAQHSVGRATLAKIDGIAKTKDQVSSGIQQQLPILYHELNQFPIDEVTEKTKMLETLLYKGMLSDILAGKAVKAAYDDNIAIFIRDYPQDGQEMMDKKRAVIATFNSIVFLN